MEEAGILDILQPFGALDLSNSAPLYSWEPLEHTNSIRLLTLHPEQDQNYALNFSLREVLLSDKVEYEALSYSWATEDGDDSPDCSAFCDGALVRITKNCQNALRQLRHDSDRVLWVDAICIDQSNKNERNHQVAIMREIYRNASHVPIYLGSPSRRRDKKSGLLYSETFAEYLTAFSAEVTALQEAGEDIELSPRYQLQLAECEAWRRSRVLGPIMRGLRDISGRRWWKRVWVVQEVALARDATILWGQNQIKYSDFNLLRQNIWKRSKASKGFVAFLFPAAHLNLFRRRRRRSRTQNSLLLLLGDARRLDASDPRDKIFSLFGAFEQMSALMPLLNYTKTVLEIFTEVTKYFLNSSKSLKILKIVSELDPTFDGPSWVVNWALPAVGLGRPPANTYDAAKGSKSEHTFENNDKDLKVMGKVIDRVQRISLSSTSYEIDIFDRMGKIVAELTIMRDMYNLGLSLKEYPTGCSVNEALWRTLCRNHRGHEYPAPDEVGETFKIYYHTILERETPFKRPKEYFKLMKQIGFPMFNPHKNLALCITEKGYLGLVPRMTKVGDSIALLCGGTAPFIIREKPSGDSYQLMGSSFVYGIMDGEAFPDDTSELGWITLQ